MISGAVSKGSQNSDHWNLIDERWDDGAFNTGTGKAGMTHQKVCGRFAGAIFLIHVSDISAHGLADFEDAGAGVVDSYILDEYLRSWDQKCAPINRQTEEISPGTKISWAYSSSHGEMVLSLRRFPASVV